MAFAAEGGIGFSGGISNAGTIKTARTGIVVATDSTFGGGISNSGTISGIGNGVLVGGQLSTSSTFTISMGTFAGGITNTGLISASGGAVSLGGVGILVGGQAESKGVVTMAAALGGIDNGGTIVAAGGGVSVGDGIVVGAQVLSGGSGTLSYFSGGVTNSGAISAHADGIIVGGQIVSGGSAKLSTFLGGITNLSGGTISAGETGIYLNSALTFSGGITNFGSISGGQDGIFVDVAGVSVFDAGTIIGSTAIVLSGSADTLTLASGFDINGNVSGTTGDIFQLGGSSNDSFNLASIGATAQYRGFSTFDVVGATWTVSSSGSASLEHRQRRDAAAGQRRHALQHGGIERRRACGLERRPCRSDLDRLRRL